MLGRTITFAVAAIVFAGLFTARKPGGVAGPLPIASPTPVKKAGFFDEIPKNVVQAAGTVTLPRGPGGHFYADATINGRRVRTLVDTGATTVALSVEDARAVGIDVDPANFYVIGSGASGAVRGLPVRLQEVSVGGHRIANVDAAVLEGLDGTLLGQSYLSRLDSVEISGDTMRLK